MTTFAQRIKETPMAPYLGLLQGMTREEKLIVVTYLRESMADREKEARAPRSVPESFKRLRGMVSITEEDMAKDEHLAHIMGR